MKRKTFLLQSSILSAAGIFTLGSGSFAKGLLNVDDLGDQKDLYKIFKDPTSNYRPFVRWWWNGNKIEKTELARELRLLKDAGIGGVEINPISFPSNTDDMGIPTVEWLSDEWIELLRFTLAEAKSLGMTCDLIAGTGFPFGAEFLEGEERSQIVVIAIKKFEGPLNTEISLFDLYKEADPAILSPYSGRTMEMLEVKLVPDQLTNMDQVINLTDQIKDDSIKISIPKGKYAIYGLVKISGFMKVIQGAPGGRGPVLNHFNEAAVKKYLNRITDTIQDKIGPLAPSIRSFFVDSLETEGTNWTSDMMDEFKKRRGYDLYSFLPFILVKIGRMGNVADNNYTVEVGSEMNAMLVRMRYDYELTKAELTQERFVKTFAQWCTDNKIKSRAQAYGRGYFLLEGSFDIDIPECETWLKYGVGEGISEKDFTKYPWHLGRGNTMINKYVSSAAHLKNKKLISSEELTNTDMVFNESLEIFKIAGDQSTISGVTHPVFHGFNYSPKEAAFPGWITYGGYFNENNNMWPYFKHYTDYRARLSALLQQATMYADIALMAPIGDMWGESAAQIEPFPKIVAPAYQMLVWESIHQNGNACDYISEQVIAESKMKNGFLSYGSRKYHTIFLIEVKSLNPSTAKKLYEFVENGGRIFCLEAYPDKSLGWNNYQKKDEEVRFWISKMKNFSDRFVFLNKPESNFNEWYKSVQLKYDITPYVSIKSPQTFITQVRYQTNEEEIFIFNNASNAHNYNLDVTFSNKVITKKQAWLWDAVTGDRKKLKLQDGNLKIDLGPADSKVIVFNYDRKGEYWTPIPTSSIKNKVINDNWKVEFKHSDGSVKNAEMNVLSDLKDNPDYVNFSGTVIYRTNVQIADVNSVQYLDLGKVYGISELIINGKNAGTKWYGRRVHSTEGLLQKGLNSVEIKVVTVMGNYMKSLKDNKTAQYWTNNKWNPQPLHSMGLVGPVTIL
jgi:hypothetical protein